MAETKERCANPNQVENNAEQRKVVDIGVCSEKLRSKEFNLTFLKMAEIAQLIWIPKETGDEEFNARLARAADLYESLALSDGGEAMLAAQMVGTHHAALECLRRAALPGQTFEGRDMVLRVRTH